MKVVNPHRFFVENPSAGLGKLARVVLDTAKKSNKDICIVEDDLGNPELIVRLLDAVERRLEAGKELEREAYVLRPQGGQRQCMWQLFAQANWDEAEMVRLLSRWYVEPLAAKSLDSSDFHSLQQIQLPEEESIQIGGPTVGFFDAGMNLTVLAVHSLSSFDISVAIFSDLADRDAKMGRLPPAQLYVLGTDAFSSLPGGLSVSEAAMAGFCGSVGIQPGRCLEVVEETRSEQELPKLKIQFDHSTVMLPQREFQRKYNFGIFLGRTKGEPLQHAKPPTQKLDSERKEIDMNGTPSNVSQVTDEVIIKHLRGRMNIFKNAKSVPITNLVTTSTTATGKAAGSTGQFYPVFVEVLDPSSITSSSCTCPYYMQHTDSRGCKHIAALIMTSRSAKKPSKKEQLIKVSDRLQDEEGCEVNRTTRSDTSNLDNRGIHAHGCPPRPDNRKLPSWLSVGKQDIDRTRRRKKTAVRPEESPADYAPIVISDAEAPKTSKTMGPKRRLRSQKRCGKNDAPVVVDAEIPAAGTAHLSISLESSQNMDSEEENAQILARRSKRRKKSPTQRSLSAQKDKDEEALVVTRDDGETQANVRMLPQVVQKPIGEKGERKGLQRDEGERNPTELGEAHESGILSASRMDIEDKGDDNREKSTAKHTRPTGSRLAAQVLFDDSSSENDAAEHPNDPIKDPTSPLPFQQSSQTPTFLSTSTHVDSTKTAPKISPSTPKDPTNTSANPQKTKVKQSYKNLAAQLFG